MRIIAGKFKGKPLKELKFEHIRPTGDKVKQALFTKLQFEIEGARVLDLFCGTGALGIEAISRGAKEVIFIDKHPKSVALTRDNLKSIKSDAKVYNVPFEKALEKVEGQFDLILIDPPYKSGYYEKAVEMIFKRNLLADDGTIVCEHAIDDTFEFNRFEVYDEKRYGSVILTYLKKGDWNPLFYML